MQSSFSTVCLLMAYFQIIIVSAIEPGYDCDDTFIPESRLNEIVAEARRTSWYGLFPLASTKLANFYVGYPFLKYYLLWPVSPTTKIYEEAAKTPFKAALHRETLQVFTVIIENEDYVKECRLREQLPTGAMANDFNCGLYHVYREDLDIAASKACPKILNVVRDRYPARYDGPPFQGWGKQLYIFPVTAFDAFRELKDSRNHFAVINTNCKAVGAVKRSKDSFTKFERCEVLDIAPLLSR